MWGLWGGGRRTGVALRRLASLAPRRPAQRAVAAALATAVLPACGRNRLAANRSNY
jgi:hypothetical protein